MRALNGAVPDVLIRYEQSLAETGSVLLRNPTSRSQILAHARQLLTEAVAELSGEQDTGPRFTLAEDIGASRAAQGFLPNESIRAAGLLFDSVLEIVPPRIGDPGERGEAPLLLAGAMNTVLITALGRAGESYFGFLLSRIHRAHLDERHRISRELHDRIGYLVAASFRNLELFEVYRDRDGPRAVSQVAAAQRALQATLEVIREVISDLRAVETTESLEKELIQFLAGFGAEDLDASVQVNGDEMWAPPEVREQVYLIIREALRNVITHAAATRVVVRIDVSPTELHASVSDDGRGFDTTVQRLGRAGLQSMRERASISEGAMTVTSEPGRGTQVRVYVPLRQDES